MEEKILKKAEYWQSSIFDDETRNEVKRLMENNPQELIESFYQDLEFGTGGLRGIMGVGTNRMNKYTVGMATQGLSNYLSKNFPGQKIKAVISYDCRNNSEFFAKITASVFSANGIKVYLFKELRPTPELSFAIRYLGCHTGVMITASHNPKEYNGYKVYWQDGGQVINPHDKAIIEEVRNISDVSQVKFDESLKNVEYILEEIDEVYTDRIKEILLNKDEIQKANLNIVFTPIHGSTVKILPKALAKAGFKNVNIVQEQGVPDGNFSTVKSPNPEEISALEMGINLARELNADIVMGTDPDGDRLGIVIRRKNGDYLALNGNQTATILTWYLLEEWKRQNKLTGKEFIVKTIVTTDLLAEMAKYYNVKYFDVLTGFKYIADLIEKNFGKLKFIGGGEESYGYLVDDFVRDKDAVLSCTLIAEIASWAKNRNMTLEDLLIDIYVKFGYYLEGLKSITKTGIRGLQEIKQMMENFRNSTPQTINSVKVVMLHDFLKSKSVDMISDLRYDINLPKSDVLQFDLKDGTKITVRPSGTEPKIKFYVSVKDKLDSYDEYENKTRELKSKIESYINWMVNYK
ncbi:MAG TPA: phospho-sugar mutase [Bacteroidales bacterium]|jgi:phosphoglucomutase|nr:phospho-sugar mutase [Bacteroidales bacterium]HOL97095.1 phospho-sugar mutase [Bacteroidales bacterium]HOM36004.1 phospho-sugar mutase [Bacteroidales bacterium]HPD23382.1 phospho-sugar mutase [Bacteroidales bacterium]HRS99450.1 phospho-sugar mutase [Bacteroidales bacterium]